MNQPASFPPIRSILRVDRIILLAMTVGVIAIPAIGWSATPGLPLFGRIDVWAVAVGCTVPLAIGLLQTWQQPSPLLGFAAGSAAWIMGGWMFLLGPALTQNATVGVVMLTLYRGCLATLLMLGCLLCLQRWRPVVPELPLTASRLWWGSTLVALALLVPAAYADAVAENLRGDLQDSLERQQVAVAFRQAAQLRQLQPNGTIEGTPVGRLEQEVGEALAGLQQAAQPPLPPAAPLPVIGQRVTVLIRLDRNREAFALVEPLTRGERFHPVALDYVGLCHQRMDQPAASLKAYRRAAEYWEAEPPSEARRQGLVSALKGIGFAARRLEDRSLEETTYRKLVERAPTAEHHFLLAQCYREHQKATLAAEHATTAIALDSQFREPGEALLSSLSMDHFGCLLVPRP